MDHNDVLNDYKKIAIKSPDDLYDYVVKHDEAFINDRRFDLNSSNEVMEFMALFLSMENYNLTRLYFEKELSNGKSFKHWFLTFRNGDRWYYFEPVVEEILGQYGFDSYNEMMFYIINKLNQNFNGENKHYTLKEISQLNNSSYDDDVKQSLNGMDILINEALVPNVNGNASSNEHDASGIFDGDKFFAIGFVIAFGICIFIWWSIL